MAFLSISGLKKAYESLEGEISRTFDPTRGTDDPTPPPEASPAPEETPSGAGGEEKKGGDEEESWGEWEAQDKSGSKNRGMQLSSGERKKDSSPAPPPPQPAEPTPSPVASSTPSKTGGGGKLDSLPKAELVKYIKRQAQLLQKTKSRCDELAKECSQLKETPDQPSGVEAAMEELQVVRRERDRAVAEQRTLQLTVSSLEQEKQTLNEEKQLLEKAVKGLESSEEDWRCRVEVAATQLSAQQKEHEEKMGQLVTQLADAEKMAETQREEEEREREESERKEREGRERIGELQRQLEELRGSLEGSEKELERVRGDVREAREEVGREREEKCELEKELNQLRTDISEREKNKEGEREEKEEKEEKEATADYVLELERKIESMECRLASVVGEKEELEKAAEGEEEERKTLSSQLESLRRELGEREGEVEELGRRVRESGVRIDELEKEHSVLQTRGEEGRDREEEEEGREEMEALRQECEEKEREVTRLKSEVVRLQQESQKKVEEAVRREQSSSQQSLSEQAESQTKKLKAYIVKMKRELSEARDKMAADSASSDKEKAELQRQMDTMREALGVGQQSVTESEDKIREAEGTVKTLRGELSVLTSERDGLQSDLSVATEELSVLRSELSTVQSDLATLQTQVGGARRAAEATEKEAGSLREELVKEKENHSSTKQKLTAAVKEAKVTNVMNLELADYQRSLQNLKEKLTGTHGELEEAREDGKRQLEKMDSTRKEIDLKTQQAIAVEDRLSKTKSLWMKTKKELDAARKTEGELNIAMASLGAQLESEKQQAETSKVEMAALTARLQSMQQQSDSSVGVLQRTVRSLEHKLAAAQSDLTTSQLSLSQCQQDYNNYKIRVHSVLKQKSSGPNPAEISTEIRQRFEAEIVQLKAELQESKSQLSSALVELEEVTEEHQTLTSTHQQLLQTSQTELSSAHRQLEEAESRHGREAREQEGVIQSLRQEVVEVTETFRGQLQALQEEHQKVVTSLSSELDTTRTSLTRLQQEADARVLARASSHSSGPAHPQTHVSTETMRNADSAVVVPSEQRVAGEGMDQSELNSFPPTPLSREDSQLSFERLLSMTADPDAPLPPSSALPPSTYSSNGTPGEVLQPHQLRRELVKAKKTIRDLTELLRESEEAGVRLGEQAKLLKEEIRRLERNREREEGVSNMEYLKNVVLKFLHAEDSGEQAALIPVITQLLRLSPQETRFLQDTIKGTPAPLPDAGTSLPSPSTHKGLPGYIHRWTGY